MNTSENRALAIQNNQWNFCPEDESQNIIILEGCWSAAPRAWPLPGSDFFFPFEVAGWDMDANLVIQTVAPTPRPDGISFPGRYEIVPPVLARLVRLITEGEAVHINIWDTELERLAQRALEAEVDWSAWNSKSQFRLAEFELPSSHPSPCPESSSPSQTHSRCPPRT